MNRIELSDEETTVLAEVLRSEVSDLSMEIADTDSLDFRERLKHKKSLLEGLARRLENAPVA
jgi:hypothetical protein